MRKMEIYWGEIINPASRQDNNTRYMIIKPLGEDKKDHITTYTDLESLIKEINNNSTGREIIATFPQDYKIIKCDNKIYSIYPLSDEKRKAIETSLTKYASKHKKRL